MKTTIFEVCNNLPIYFHLQLKLLDAYLFSSDMTIRKIPTFKKVELGIGDKLYSYFNLDAMKYYAKEIPYEGFIFEHYVTVTKTLKGNQEIIRSDHSPVLKSLLNSLEHGASDLSIGFSRSTFHIFIPHYYLT